MKRFRYLGASLLALSMAVVGCNKGPTNPGGDPSETYTVAQVISEIENAFSEAGQEGYTFEYDGKGYYYLYVYFEDSTDESEENLISLIEEVAYYFPTYLDVDYAAYQEVGAEGYVPFYEDDEFTYYEADFITPDESVLIECAAYLYEGTECVDIFVSDISGGGGGDVPPVEGGDYLDIDCTEATDQNYVDWTYNGDSGAVYSGNSAGGDPTSGTVGEVIQLRSKNSNSGIVTTTSGGTITAVVISFNENTNTERKVDVYVSSSPYSSPSDLYGSSAGTKIGTAECGNSTTWTVTITGGYTYVGIRSNSGACYLDFVQFVWE